MTTEQFQKNVFISIFLDARRAKQSGKYPVKLRVFTSSPRQQKLYATKFEFTETEFASIWGTTRPRAEFKPWTLQLRALEQLATEVASGIHPFSFDRFEQKWLKKGPAVSDVLGLYDDAIKKLEENNQLGTASTYTLARKSLLEFIKWKRGSAPGHIHFTDITPGLLANYEHYMVSNLQRSRTTVSMYLRTLRTIFNTAIADKLVDAEFYPFGKRRYVIPAPKGTKKALAKPQLKLLYEAEPFTLDQRTARDYWFFSYICNGMNMKDIAMLRLQDVKEQSIVYFRAKTINTAKADLRPVVVPITDYAREFIGKYASGSRPGDLIFPIISDQDTEAGKRVKIQNFTRYVNQHLKKLAASLGITEEISTYWARHSFATAAIRSGSSMELVSEALNHSNLKTTQAYFAGFEDRDKKDLMDSLLRFE